MRSGMTQGDFAKMAGIRREHLAAILAGSPKAKGSIKPVLQTIQKGSAIFTAAALDDDDEATNRLVEEVVFILSHDPEGRNRLNVIDDIYEAALRRVQESAKQSKPKQQKERGPPSSLKPRRALSGSQNGE